MFDAGDAFSDYVERQLASGERLHAITRHLHGLYKHTRGSTAWKRYLSTHAHKRVAGIEVLRHARTLTACPVESPARDSLVALHSD